MLAVVEAQHGLRAVEPFMQCIGIRRHVQCLGDQPLQGLLVVDCVEANEPHATGHRDRSGEFESQAGLADPGRADDGE